MELDPSVWLFLGGQAATLLTAIIASHVKTAVRLKEIELMLKHTDKSSMHNAMELSSLKKDVHALTIKVEHIQTTQSMLCQACPMRPHNHAFPDAGGNK